jgi:hypothetical protein
MNANNTVNEVLKNMDPMTAAKIFVERWTIGQIEEVHGGYQYHYYDIETNEDTVVGPCIDMDALNRNREQRLQDYAFSWSFGELNIDTNTGIISYHPEQYVK